MTVSVMLRIAVLIFILFVSFSAVFAQASSSRFFFHGDGHLKLKNGHSGASFSGKFRNDDGSYDALALGEINRAFSANFDRVDERMSLRFIEFLDYLEDNLNKGALITIASGYRNPEYNTNLRNNGKLAAKASLHQYGMASDVKFAGVDSQRVWDYVKGLKFGGAGFYHGALVHVDTGPARFWDEATSGVGTDIADDNKLIMLTADRDIYLPSEEVELRFIRMTAFPIGVAPEFVLERKGRKGRWKTVEKFRPVFLSNAEGACPKFGDIAQMAGIKRRLPDNVNAGRYRVRAVFCDKEWPAMPQGVSTAEFEIKYSR